MDIDQIMQMLNEKSGIRFVRFISDKGPNSCKACLAHHGKIFRMDDPEKPQLPIHPNCRCRYEEIKESEIIASATTEGRTFTSIFRIEKEQISPAPAKKAAAPTEKTSIAKQEQSSFNHVAVRVLAPGDRDYGKFSTIRRFWDFSHIGMLSCTSIDDLLTCLEKKISPRKYFQSASHRSFGG